MSFHSSGILMWFVPSTYLLFLIQKLQLRIGVMERFFYGVILRCHILEHVTEYDNSGHQHDPSHLPEQDLV